MTTDSLANPPAISVVICTCGRAEMIGDAVRSVLEQAYPTFEVLVVDQSTDRETESVVTRLPDPDRRVRYLRLSERGLSRAYNQALSCCGNELVAFTDDDCVAPRDWLETVARAFEKHPDVDLVYGQVLEPDPDQMAVGSGAVIPTLRIARPQRISMRRGFKVFGMGANFAARRSALRRLGGFDEVLGGGGPLQSAQDFDLAYRLCRAGGTILLEPAIAVRHFGVRSADQWPATARSYGIGVGGFYFKHVRAGDVYAAWLLARVLTTGYARLAKRFLFRQPTLVHRTYLGNIGVGIKSSLEFAVDRGHRLYQLKA